MPENFYNSFKRIVKRNKDLSFIVILLLGLFAVFLSCLKLSVYWIEDRTWQDTYQSVMSNMSAGFLIAAITYFLARIFILGEEELDFLKNPKSTTTDSGEILGAISGLKNSINRLEGIQEGYHVFHDKKKLFKHLFSIMENAEHKVLSVGYGFNYNDPEESNLADLFIASIHNFLNVNGRSKEFRHYQYNNYPNTRWLGKLVRIKIEFETTFNFYYGDMNFPRDSDVQEKLWGKIDKGNPSNPIWVITVDPESENTYTIVIFTKEVRTTYNRPFDFMMGFIFNDRNISQKKLQYFRPYFEKGSKILNIGSLVAQPDNFVHGVLYGINKNSFEVFSKNKMEMGFKQKNVKVKLGDQELAGQTFYQEEQKQNNLNISNNFKTSLLSWLERTNDLEDNYITEIKNLIS